jgi:hypothetical protein
MFSAIKGAIEAVTGDFCIDASNKIYITLNQPSYIGGDVVGGTVEMVFVFLCILFIICNIYLFVGLLGAFLCQGSNTKSQRVTSSAFFFIYLKFFLIEKYYMLIFINK